MKAFLEHFAAVVGAVTVAILAMSLCHEYGYFWSIGPQFQTLLTTSDYFANGVLWLPLALFAAFNWIDWWRLREAPLPPIDWKRKSTWFWFAVLFVTFGAATVSLRWPIDLFPASVIMFVTVVFWSWLWPGYADTFANAEPPFNVIAKQLVRLGPPLLVLMFLYGSVDAGFDLTRVDGLNAFYFKDSSVPQLRIFLRNFDKGVLVRNAVSGTIEFYKWDNIVSITRPEPKKSKYLICWLVVCSPQTASPK